MVEISENDLKHSLGAILLGGLVCAWLSGIVCIQTALYFRMFSQDHFFKKLKVSVVCLLDILHTAMIASASYMYFVESFGQRDVTDHAFWAIGISIALTAVLTVIVHFFYAYRLFKLSKGNYWVTVPIFILATARVVAALVTTTQLIRLESFSEFGARYDWVFTLGLVLSSAVDFLITSALCYYLRKNRTGNDRFDHILDSVTLYTVENGLLTSVTTLLSLIFWLALPHVLVYLGLHFAISKLYANSYLASMNARKTLQAQSESFTQSGHHLPVILTNRVRHQEERLDFSSAVQITVEVDKTVDFGTNEVDRLESGTVSNDQKNKG